MPVNIPVTLRCTQATAVSHVDAVAKNLDVSEATSVVTKRVPSQHMVVTEPTSIALAEARNHVVFTITEPTSVRERTTVHKPFAITEATALTMRHTHGGVFRITQPSSLTLTYGVAHSRKFVIPEVTNLVIDSPTVARTLAIRQRTNPIEQTTVHHQPFHLTETVSAILDSTSGRVHRLVINQPTAVHVHRNPTSHHKVAETTHVVRHSTPVKTYKVVEHTVVHEHGVPNKVFHMTEAAAVKHVDHPHTSLHATELVAVKHLSDPRPILRATQSSSIKVTKTPGVVSAIKEHVRVTKHALTHHEPFVMTEATVVKRTSGLNAVLKAAESTTASMGPRGITKYVKVPVHTTVVVRAPQLVRLTVPIMGYIYEPTDVYGSQVQVLADLNDYYYTFSDDSTPKLYWGPNERSSDVPNDSYNYWKTK